MSTAGCHTPSPAISEKVLPGFDIAGEQTVLSSRQHDILILSRQGGNRIPVQNWTLGHEDKGQWLDSMVNLSVDGIVRFGYGSFHDPSRSLKSQSKSYS